MEMTGAQIIVETLIEQGVDTLFAYPGGTVLNIFDALGEYKDKIRLIMPAHEQGGAHAADGYARVSGKTGVVLATSGPGATNLVTGIANAYMDSIPMVAITGNVALSLIGRDSFQEVDICGITMPITKHNFMVEDVSDLASTIKEAFEIAASGRPGPVLIDIPKDVTAQTFEYKSSHSFGVGKFSVRETPAPAEGDLKQLIEMFEKSSRPLVFCGGGILRAQAHEALLKFCEDTNTPIAASLMGLSAVPGEHPLMLGMIGMHGTPYANYAGEICDLMICCGTRFSDRVAGDRKRFAPNAKLIHIDIDVSEFDKNVICDLHISGNAKTVFEKLLAMNCPPCSKDWHREILHYKAKNPMPAAMDPKRTNPRSIPRIISQLAGEDAVIVTDVGQHQMWTAQYYRFSKPNSFVSSGGLGAMGFGMGAAVGSKAAAGKRPVVLITGDGSFHMNLAELATSVTENLPVIVVVLNNGVLGMVRQWQNMFYGCRFVSTTTGRPTDYVKLAEAFGALGFRAGSMEEFEKKFTEALASGRTCVIECEIDPDEKVFPMIPPGKSSKDILFCD